MPLGFGAGVIFLYLPGPEEASSSPCPVACRNIPAAPQGGEAGVDSTLRMLQVWVGGQARAKMAACKRTIQPAERNTRAHQAASEACPTRLT